MDQPLCTVLLRARQRLGRIPSNDMLRNIGARAANAYRTLYRRDPPKVGEYHADLGQIQVFTYPWDVLAIVDDAIDVFARLEGYTAPPLPPAQSA